MLPPAQKASILGATSGGGGGGGGIGPQPTNLTIKKVASQDKLRGGEQKEQQRKSTSPAPPSQDEIKQKTVSVTYIHVRVHVCTCTCCRRCWYCALPVGFLLPSLFVKFEG